jgi:hypothetical protein
MSNKIKSVFGRKIIIKISVISLAALILPSFVLAQGSQQGQADQQRVQDPTTHSDTAVVSSQGNQVQNQVNTQNAGEDSQLQVNTQESFEANEEGVKSQGRSDTARQNMSMVAQKVEELLSDETNQGGIGQQVKDIANQQKQAQGEIKQQLDKLESRQGLMKKLFGADPKTIKNLKQQIEQNQLRIQQFQQLQNQTTNQADETQLQEMIQALTEQNTALADQVQIEEQVGSVFGWLIKLFAK